MGQKLNWFASGRFMESHDRTPNAYNRVINGFGKIGFQPNRRLKLTVSALIEDRGAFSGKGQRPELVGDNYLWKYIPEGLNERFLGNQFYNVELIHAPVDRWYYRMRISHHRAYDESYNPALGTGPVPTINDPAGTPGVSTLEFFGYNPGESSGIGGVNPGYRVYGEEALAGSATFDSVQPRTTDFDFSTRILLVERNEFKIGVRMTLPYTTLWARPLAQPRSASSAGDGRVVFRYCPRESGLYAVDRVNLGKLTAEFAARFTLLTMNGSLGSPRTDIVPATRRRRLFDPRLGLNYRIVEWLDWHGATGSFSQRLDFDSLDIQRSRKWDTGLHASLPSGFQFNISASIRSDSFGARSSLLNFVGFVGGYNRSDFTTSELELSLRKRATGRFASRMSYSLFRESPAGGLRVATATNVGMEPFGEYGPSVPLTRFLPGFRVHQFVFSATANLPLETFVSVLTRAQKGYEYDVGNASVADPLGILGPARRLPWINVTDLFVQKSVRLDGPRIGFFSQIKNLFNSDGVYRLSSPGRGYRWIRRGDPVAFTGGPLAGEGLLPNTSRDVYVGMNIQW